MFHEDDEYFYVSVPQSWLNRLTQTEVQGTLNERIALGAKLKSAQFQLNKWAHLSPGDLYRITLNDGDDILFVLLRTGFTLLNKDTINQALAVRQCAIRF